MCLLTGTLAPDRYAPIDFRANSLASDEPLFAAAVEAICSTYGKYLTAANTKLPAPRALTEALQCHDADLWQEALAEEYIAFKEKGVIEVRPWKPGLITANTRYMLTYKLRPNNPIERCKFHIVVKGYTQKYGEDSLFVWAPTGSLVAYRAMLTYAAHHHYDVSLMDIKCAFLKGTLKERIYAKPPPGLDEGCVWRLHRAVCGLRQAARAWHACLRDCLSHLGYHSSAVDPALFIRSFPNGEMTAGTGPPGGD